MFLFDIRKTAEHKKTRGPQLANRVPNPVKWIVVTTALLRCGRRRRFSRSRGRFGRSRCTFRRSSRSRRVGRSAFSRSRRVGRSRRVSRSFRRRRVRRRFRRLHPRRVVPIRCDRQNDDRDKEKQTSSIHSFSPLWPCHGGHYRRAPRSTYLAICVKNGSRSRRLMQRSPPHVLARLALNIIRFNVGRPRGFTPHLGPLMGLESWCFQRGKKQSPVDGVAPRALCCGCVATEVLWGRPRTTDS